ncbi:VOC family protein [Novosphingobium sp. PP1Y]|uniref:VOC family protein n=1 Tax=Novosphingobium sp. PP1Y TaxID=702113 RepID=UPI00020EF36D|nr:glyoxalase/bleomycin resistance/extradiol dioxygenase family protein [Novosphingobium sp. PP1Y]CCA94016.1 glyoxalase/bleomycin resistance protein/dioxygenase [Novosphingobium sp. PP1Y]
MIRGIHHIGIHTGNLDRLRAFYEAAFGFEAVGEEVRLEDFEVATLVVGVPDAKARILMMRTANCLIELFEWQTPKGDKLEPAKAYDRGYTHFMVDVTDIDAEYERLSALGMTFVHPMPLHFGANASVYGHDPDGNLIEIGMIPESESLHLKMPA